VLHLRLVTSTLLVLGLLGLLWLDGWASAAVRGLPAVDAVLGSSEGIALVAFAVVVLAPLLGRELAALLRADNFTVVFGDSQHAHHDIFGDGDGVNACAIGDDAALRLQLRQRHAVDTRINAVQPFHLGGGANDRGHVALVIHIKPANLRLRS